MKKIRKIPLNHYSEAHFKLVFTYKTFDEITTSFGNVNVKSNSIP